VFGLNVAPDDGINDQAGVTGNGAFVGVVGNSDIGGFGLASLTSILALADFTAVGIKAFTIDHPQDPENKYLRHFAIESNEVINMYRGNVILDENGNGEVEMPAYFESINKDFSYQLTAVGAPAPGIYVSQELANGKFKISGGSAGQKISWQVTAERNDAYMQAYPDKANAEPMKPENRRGRYLRPELYGQPKSKSMIGNSPQLEEVIKLKEAAKEQKPASAVGSK
jgi:hypothetical protein